MKYTNKFNLDRTVVEVLEHDDYDYNSDSKVISATSLISPARQVALKRLHYDELSVDVSDLIASRYGTAIHAAFENIKLTDCIQEQRLKAEFDNFTLSGKFDILRREGIFYRLIDIKSTSVWKLIMGDYDQYIKQLSIYRYLCVENGYDTMQEAYIYFFFTDWQKRKAKEDPEYPQLRFHKLELKLWTIEETKKFIIDRYNKITIAEQLIKDGKESDIETTTEELWQRPDKFAVMKGKQKRAVKLYDSKLKAEAHIGEDKGYHIDTRKEVAKRCSYCACTRFCDLYTRLKKDRRVE